MLRQECRFTFMAAVLMSGAHAAVTLSVTASANPTVYAVSLTYTVAVAPPAPGDPIPTGVVSAILDGSHLLASAALDAAGCALIAIPPLDAGSSALTFSYSGDGRYAQAQSNFTQFLTQAHSNTAAALNGRQATATVRIEEPLANSGGAPSGTVRFFDGTTLLGTATLAPSSLLTSVAELTTSTAPESLTAVYSGDANFNSSRSAIAFQTGAGSVTLSVISSANPSVNPAVFAEPITLKIAVAPVAAGAPIPTGSVAASLLGLFSLGTVTLDANGQGSLAVPMSSAAGIPWGFPAGSSNVLLTYSGDANYANAQTNFTQLVNKADTVISTGGDGRATVSTYSPTKTPTGFALPGGNPGSANPTGSVQFLQGGIPMGTGTLRPTGHLQSTAYLATGASPDFAMYSGDANHNGSVSRAVTEQSQAATVTVTSSANPASFAEPVTFSVTVASSVAGSSIPTGTILATVYGSETLGSAFLDATGKASFTVPQTLVFNTSANYDGYLPLPWGLATGSNVITVTYSGDSNYAQGQTTFNEMINKVDTLTSVAAVAAPAKSFTITATVAFHELAITLTPFAIPSTGNVSPSPTGNVNFYDGTTLIGTSTLLQGINFTSTATLTTASEPVSVSAVYSGDTNFNGSSSASTTLSAGAVTLSLGASTDSLVYGEVFPIVATVYPAIPGSVTPTGTLTFFDGSQNLGWTATLDAAGVGTLPIPEPLPTPAACAPNCPAAAPVLVLSPGSHSITATYSGDANYAAMSSSPLSLQVAKAPSTTALAGVCAVALPGQCFVSASVADAQPPTGGPVHFMTMGASGLMDGDPSGTVQFFSGTTLIGTASLTSSAALSVTSSATLSSTGGGSSAVYSGDANFQGSSSLAFSGFATSVNLTASPNPSTVGQSVTLTVNVVPSPVLSPAIVAPTGTVTFLDSATPLGQAPLSGAAATLTTSFTTAGPHFLSVTYSGDSFYLPSTSAGYGQIVTSPSGALGVLSLTPSAPAASYGQQMTFFVGVTGSGFAAPGGHGFLLDGMNVIAGWAWDLNSAVVIVTLPVGTHQLWAAWPGDAFLPPAVSPVLAYVVTRAPTIITLGGQPLTATVSASPAGAGTPTGTVQFTAQGLTATSTLSAGSATASLAAGTSGPIVAAYSGDANFAPSTTAPPSLAMVVVSGVVSSVVAPDEIATIYGANLATSTAPGTLPLSTSLAGVSVTVTDIDGVSRLAPLYYVSAGQINFVVPTGTASGPATLTVAGQNLAISVAPVSPNLFPVGQIVAVDPDGTQSIYDTDAPIVFGSNNLYLVLYGTGIRSVASVFAVTCTVGNNLNLPVTYAGAQSQYPGLDQVVVPLPPSLQGAGTVKVVVTANGYASNAISLTFQ